MSDRFARRVNRGSGDPELDAMRNELNIYWRMEEKEQLQETLEEKRAKFKDQLDSDDAFEVAKLQEAVKDIGFTVTDGRRNE